MILRPGQRLTQRGRHSPWHVTDRNYILRQVRVRHRLPDRSLCRHHRPGCRFCQTFNSDIGRKSGRVFFGPAVPPPAVSRRWAWRHISDRRNPSSSNHNTWSHIPGRRASPHGLMVSYLRFPHVTDAIPLIGANVWYRTSQASAAHPRANRRSVCSAGISARRTTRLGMRLRTSSTGESWGAPRASGHLAPPLAGKWS